MIFTKKYLKKEVIFTVDHKRTAVVYIVMTAMMLFVVFRLYAVMNSQSASQALSGQYTRKLDAVSRRGFIYDRNGNLMNMKRNGYVCLVDPAVCDDFYGTSEKLAELSSCSQSEIYDKMLNNTPFTIRTNECTAVDGVCFYPVYDNTAVCAPHIVGYTDGDGRGVSGVEKYFDRTLSEIFSGEVSYRYMSDALGAVLENTSGSIFDYGYTEKSGIYLTFDRDLQMFCEQLAKKYRGSGAICITDTATSEVLALVSFPDFDSSNVADYLDSDKGELVNRCISGFTPGSLFKTVVAAASLEYDAGLFNLEYECTGSFETEDGEIIPCHKKEGHGIVDMKNAYAQSCNPYFINLAHIIGDGKITETARDMGLMQELDLDGIFSFGNTVPEYSEKISAKSGYLANLSIGQGKMLISPLSACSLFSCAATGIYTDLGILSKITAGDITVRDYPSLRKSRKVLSAKTVSYLSEMMKYCVTDGLGKEAMPKNGSAAGKTATAQSGIVYDGKQVLNCWFCGVYPSENPIYTVCVLYCDTENGGIPKNIFREICDYLA